MKKCVVFSVVGFLILTLGPVAYSQPIYPFTATPPPTPKFEFKVSGYMDTFTTLNRNVPDPPWNSTGTIFGPHVQFLPGTPRFDKTSSWVESRMRLRFDAWMGNELKGTIYLEGDSNRWGEVARADAAQRNQMGQWGSDRAAVEIKNAFISAGISFIPFPTQIHVGILPIAVRPGVLAYNDGSGVVIESKIDPVSIILKYAKALENQDFASDDADVYGVEANMRVGKLTVGAFGHNWNMNTYPITIPNAFINPGGAGPGFPNVDFTANFTWFGAYADGRVGPVDINFDLVFDKGKVEDQRDISARSRDVKYSGWLSRLKVDYPWEKFNFGAVGTYASGADAKKTSFAGFPGQTAAAANVPSSRVSAFILPPFSEHGAGDAIVFYPWDFVRATPGFSHAPGPAVGGGTNSGTWFAKLYGSYKVAPYYKITLGALYIGDTTKNGNTVGNARKAPFGPMDLRDDKTVGWELDLQNDFQVYRNLTFQVGAGILLAGDALDYFNTSTGRNVSPDNPWNIFTKLTYRF